MKANSAHTENKRSVYPLLYDGNGRKYDPQEFVEKCLRPLLKHDHHEDWHNYFDRHKDFAERLPKKVKPVNRIDRFEKAAREENYQEFESLISSVDLSRYQPSEILSIIGYCLSLDMISTAFELAKMAIELFHGNTELERAYRALRPPKVIGTRPVQGK